jgi:hypothetical protein
MPRGTYQTIGTQIPPSKGPATGGPFANPGNQGTFQMTGDSLPLQRTPTMQSPSANPKEGIRQDGQASKSSMTRTPVKMINETDTSLPFSERAHKQSETA